MPNENTSDQKDRLKAIERICAKCGKHYIVRRDDGAISSRALLKWLNEHPEVMRELRKRGGLD